MEQGKSIQVAYMPKILRNMNEICEVMGVGEVQIKKWINDGAPITVEGNGTRIRYSAELMRLYMWREEYSKKR